MEADNLDIPGFASQQDSHTAASWSQEPGVIPRNASAHASFRSNTPSPFTAEALIRNGPPHYDRSSLGHRSHLAPSSAQHTAHMPEAFHQEQLLKQNRLAIELGRAASEVQYSAREDEHQPHRRPDPYVQMHNRTPQALPPPPTAAYSRAGLQARSDRRHPDSDFPTRQPVHSYPPQSAHKGQPLAGLRHDHGLHGRQHFTAEHADRLAYLRLQHQLQERSIPLQASQSSLHSWPPQAFQQQNFNRQSNLEQNRVMPQPSLHTHTRHLQSPYSQGRPPLSQTARLSLREEARYSRHPVSQSGSSRAWQAAGLQRLPIQTARPIDIPARNPLTVRELLQAQGGGRRTFIGRPVSALHSITHDIRLSSNSSSLPPPVHSLPARTYKDQQPTLHQKAASHPKSPEKAAEQRTLDDVVNRANLFAAPQQRPPGYSDIAPQSVRRPHDAKLPCSPSLRPPIPHSQPPIQYAEQLTVSAPDAPMTATDPFYQSHWSRAPSAPHIHAASGWDPALSAVLALPDIPGVPLAAASLPDTPSRPIAVPTTCAPVEEVLSPPQSFMPLGILSHQPSDDFGNGIEAFAFEGAGELPTLSREATRQQDLSCLPASNLPLGDPDPNQGEDLPMPHASMTSLAFSPPRSSEASALHKKVDKTDTQYAAIDRVFKAKRASNVQHGIGPNIPQPQKHIVCKELCHASGLPSSDDEDESDSDAGIHLVSPVTPADTLLVALGVTGKAAVTVDELYAICTRWNRSAFNKDGKEEWYAQSWPGLQHAQILGGPDKALAKAEIEFTLRSSSAFERISSVGHAILWGRQMDGSVAAGNAVQTSPAVAEANDINRGASLRLEELARRAALIPRLAQLGLVENAKKVAAHKS